MRINDGYLGNGAGRINFTTFDTPPGTGELWVGHSARKNQPIVNFALDEDSRGRRRRIELKFVVPDFVVDPLTGAWDVADRDRYLHWLGLGPT
ncbi:hypothetical protein LG293_16050 (plasmid) [Citricoccus nitrophenolicus]